MNGDDHCKSPGDPTRPITRVPPTVFTGCRHSSACQQKGYEYSVALVSSQTLLSPAMSTSSSAADSANWRRLGLKRFKMGTRTWTKSAPPIMRQWPTQCHHQQIPRLKNSRPICKACAQFVSKGGWSVGMRQYLYLSREIRFRRYLGQRQEQK